MRRTIAALHQELLEHDRHLAALRREKAALKRVA
jgi:hypothetical protein